MNDFISKDGKDEEVVVRIVNSYKKKSEQSTENQWEKVRLKASICR